jgi:hypothetical protein
METNFLSTVELTDEQKFKIYMKIPKKYLVDMHIQAEKVIAMLNSNIPSIYPYGLPDNCITISLT